MPRKVYSSTEMKIIQHGQHHLGGAYYGAILGKNVSDPTITGSNYKSYSYNPFVNSKKKTGYSYYLFYTNGTSSYSGTIKSNEDITVQTLLVGGGGTSDYNSGSTYGGGGAGGVIAGSFQMKANKIYTINVGLGGVFDGSTSTSSSIVSPNGTIIVQAYGGDNGYNSGDGGSSGGTSYDSSFNVLYNYASTSASGGTSNNENGGNPGGGGAYGQPGNGGLCFPNNGTNNALVFADGLSSNILFGGGGGGGGGGYNNLPGGSGGGGIYGGKYYNGGNNQFSSGGGGGGGGFIDSLSFGPFNLGTFGGSGTSSTYAIGGSGGFGGGGGGGGYNSIISGGSVSGNGGNGVVMIYFKNP